MRKIILTILILVTCCTGCSPKTITLIQPAESITSIQLVFDRSYYENDDQSVIYELSAEEFGTFAEVLCSFRVHKPWNPGGSLGYFYVHIQYSNGDQECIGTDGYEYILAAGESDFDGFRTVDYGELYDLFSSYVGEETMNALRER